MKTGAEVEGDFFEAIVGSDLAGSVSGAVYRAGTRPRDSTAEDIVVKLTAIQTGQRQLGYVTVIVYVPDIDNGVGNYVANTARLEKIEAVAQEVSATMWLRMPSYNNVELATGIQSYPDPEISQHFVSVKYQFEIIN